MSATELLDDWRATRRRLHEALLAVPSDRKLVWFGPPMSSASMATARLMETWAHGLDVADALGVVRPATERLRSIAHLGVRIREPRVHGVEMLAPDGSMWALVERTPPSGSPVRPKTSAIWSRSVVRCRRSTSSRSGDDAKRWLTIAQAFAGPPGPGRD